MFSFVKRAALQFNRHIQATRGRLPRLSRPIYVFAGVATTFLFEYTRRMAIRCEDTAELVKSTLHPEPKIRKGPEQDTIIVLNPRILENDEVAEFFTALSTAHQVMIEEFNVLSLPFPEIIRVLAIKSTYPLL
jgi:hypothetical protein